MTSVARAKRKYSRPLGMVTGEAPRQRANLRYLNKVQELCPDFMARLRDEIFPIWRRFMEMGLDRRDDEAKQLVTEIVVRIQAWASSYHLDNRLTDELIWQFERWEELEAGIPIPLRFDREFEISDTQIHGLYPFFLVTAIDFDEEELPACVDRIKPENYASGREYAAAVSSVNGARGVWKLSPDHAGLDQRCEMLVRFQVLKQSETEIIELMNLSVGVQQIRDSSEQLAAMIGQTLRPDHELQGLGGQ